MYTSSTTDIPSGQCYRLMDAGSPLTFRQYFQLLESDPEFADWYSGTLAGSDAEAFFWELPALTSSTLDDDVEFVLIEAPMLERLTPEPAPFAQYFDRVPGEDVVVFRNLGGDAVLVVPSPRGPAGHYAHFAAFLRGGDSAQVRALWQSTAQQVLSSIGERPVWLSTAGGGVAWLHIRLDNQPKYYRHVAYRRP